MTTSSALFARESASGSSQPDACLEDEAAEYYTNYKEKKDQLIYYRGEHSLPHHAILHFLRGQLECYHRERISNHAAHPYAIYRPYLDMDGPGGFLPMCSTLDQDGDCCNRTAPFYILSDLDTENRIHLFFTKLHNWLYMKWFRPYESEIDYCQFIAATICPKPISSLKDTPPGELIAKIIKLNNRACQQVEEYRERLAHPDPASFSDEELFRLHPNEHELFLLQTTFRAVIVVVNPHHHDASGLDDMGGMPVYIILTGIAEGLSAPVTFNMIPEEAITDRISPPHNEQWSAVKTSLVAAYNFLQTLEQREVQAFGPQPDPARFATVGMLQQSRLSLLDEPKRKTKEDDAVRLGWKGDPTPRMPSSSWVDSSLYKEWFGSGEDYHSRVLMGQEDRQRRHLRWCCDNKGSSVDNASPT